MRRTIFTVALLAAVARYATAQTLQCPDHVKVAPTGPGRCFRGMIQPIYGFALT